MILITSLLFIVTVFSEAEPLTQTPLKKPYTLLLFSTATYSGYEPRDGRICQAAMDVAVKTVNSRSDILPDYNIKVDYRDEGSSAVKAPRQFVDFLRDAEKWTEAPNSSTFLAPAVIGTATACSTIANTARELKMVQFTPGCSAFTNRKLYPNLYRNRMPADAQYLSPLMFFFNSPAHWRQIGIVNYDYSGLAGAAVFKAGFDLVYGTVETEVSDSVILALKKSDARIVDIGNGNPAQYAQFVCKAHRLGVRPPYYVFLTQASNFNDPYASDLHLPAGCTRQMWIEQTRATFWGGPFDFAIEPHGPTSFGYDGTQFDEMLDQLTNHSRSADYVRRHRCFDSMAQALLALDKADRDLKAKFGKSLKDFKKDPKLVHNTVNEAAINTDFQGLRIGRVKYTSPQRVEIDDEVQYITQWVGKDDLRILYEIRFNSTNTSRLHDVTAYSMTKRSGVEPTWFTRDGKAPKDLSNRIHRFDGVSIGAFSILAALAGFGVVGICFASYLLFRRKAPMIRVDILGALGCILANAAAISIGTTVQSSNSANCFIQILLAIFGLSTIDGTIVIRMVALVRRLRMDPRAILKEIHSNRNTPIGKNKRVSVTMEEERLHAMIWEKRILRQVLIFLAINSVAIVAILAADPVKLASWTDPVEFDVQADSYVDLTRYYCDSGHLGLWLPAIAAVHALGLILSVVLVYEIRHVVVKPHLIQEFRATRIAVGNAATMLLALFFLLYVIPPEMTTLKTMIFSFGVMVYANSYAGISLLLNLLLKK